MGGVFPVGAGAVGLADTAGAVGAAGAGAGVPAIKPTLDAEVVKAT